MLINHPENEHQAHIIMQRKWWPIIEWFFLSTFYLLNRIFCFIEYKSAYYVMLSAEIGFVVYDINHCPSFYKWMSNSLNGV